MPTLPLEILLHVSDYLQDDITTLCRFSAASPGLRALLLPTISRLKVFYIVSLEIWEYNLLPLSETCWALHNLLAPILRAFEGYKTKGYLLISQPRRARYPRSSQFNRSFWLRTLHSPEYGAGLRWTMQLELEKRKMNVRSGGDYVSYGPKVQKILWEGGEDDLGTGLVGEFRRSFEASLRESTGHWRM